MRPLGGSSAGERVVANTCGLLAAASPAQAQLLQPRRLGMRLSHTNRVWGWSIARLCLALSFSGACALNPQPEPPAELSAAGSAGADSGRGGAGGSDVTATTGGAAGSSSGGAGGVTPQLDGGLFHDSDAQADAGENPDAGDAASDGGGAGGSDSGTDAAVDASGDALGDVVDALDLGAMNGELKPPGH